MKLAACLNAAAPDLEVALAVQVASAGEARWSAAAEAGSSGPGPAALEAALLAAMPQALGAARESLRRSLDEALAAFLTAELAALQGSAP
jgi:hypothetical protein